MSSVSLIMLVVLIVGCYSATVPRNFDPRLINDDVILTPMKRPFCNAFTGCGRKRSLGSPGMPSQEMMGQRQYVDDDALMYAEKVIEELSRQMLTQPSLWEALQGAREEIIRRKQKEAYNQ